MKLLLFFYVENFVFFLIIQHCLGVFVDVFVFFKITQLGLNLLFLLLTPQNQIKM